MGLFSLPCIAVLLVPPAPEPAPPEPLRVYVTPDPFEREGEPRVVEAQSDEAGGFMRRPAPPPPDAPPPPEVVGTRLVWGLHQPVAPWKRKGLFASLAVTGVGLVGAVITRPLAHKRWDLVLDRLEDLPAESWSFEQPGVPTCQTSLSAGSARFIPDYTLAHRCVKFERMRVASAVSVAVTTVGAVSTVTFGILHLVRREPVRRVEARADGVAIRF